LCHFLVHNPNYAKAFQQFGRGILEGKNVSFDQTFGMTIRPLLFEYRFFLSHIDQGYRVDLCAWDWGKRFLPLQADHVKKAKISAGLGWQPTGLFVQSKTRYEYAANGSWQLAGLPEAVDAEGAQAGRGRLVGALMKDYQLGEEFELGTQGVLDLKAEGDLYLRCRTDWNRLADDRGQIKVGFKLAGQGPSLQEPETEDADRR
jgi:hypothetical protein